MLYLLHFLYYSLGISTPRFTGANGQPLKGARFISNTLFKGDNPLDNRFTIMLMQWGQFIDHDITRTDPVDPGT